MYRKKGSGDVSALGKATAMDVDADVQGLQFTFMP